MTRGEAVKFVVVRSLGNFLVLFGIYGVIATFGPALYFELQYRLADARGVEFKVEEVKTDEQNVGVVEDTGNDGPGFLDVLAGSKEQVLTAPDTDFSILIPKIGAASRVYPNVDPTDDVDSMDVLRRGIAHARGSVFPGMEGNVYLFAHSADNWWNAGRYNAVFYLLKDLSVGDEIVVFFEGKRYDYVVEQHFVAEPDFVSLLTGENTFGESSSSEDKERLVLQTCWPPGTAWKRLFVVATPKSI